MDEQLGEGHATPGQQWVQGNWLLIGLFGLVTLVGVVLAAGLVGSGFVRVPSEQASDVIVEPYVYLYATLGALGYVFTKLMKNVQSYDERDELADLVEMGLRIPAAWVLATGFYLIFVQAEMGNPADDAFLLSTVSYLVGLYVNVALKSLGSIADRMLGRGTSK